MGLERRGRVKRSHAMRATDRPAVRLACLLDGSRMSREVHVRFCERLCQEDAKASCCTKDEGRPFGAVL